MSRYDCFIIKNKIDVSIFFNYGLHIENLDCMNKI